MCAPRVCVFMVVRVCDCLGCLSDACVCVLLLGVCALCVCMRYSLGCLCVMLVYVCVIRVRV